MYIAYRIDGTEKIAESSNEDIEISESKNGARMEVGVQAKKDLDLIVAMEEIPHAYGKDDLFFVNGYQSWTDSFEYSYAQKLKDANRLPRILNRTFAFPQYGDAYFYDYDRNVFHGFDLSYVKGKNPFFIASLNFKNAYLIVEHHKKRSIAVLKSDVENISLKKGESVKIYDYIISDDIQKGSEEYFSHFTPPKAKKLFGYTSWYNHYQDIDEKKIRKALDEASDGFELFQIDDGFEQNVGDWLKIDERKFPNGLSGIVQDIHSRGLKAGIWLAPFAAETKSEVFRNHPDWFVKDADGKPLKAGANWSHFYALDLDVPEAEEYVRKFLGYYMDLGFDFFKLDFLYAASMVPAKSMSRAQTAQRAYSLLREVLGEKLILGCGAVVSNSFENFDYLRIGPDVSLIFDDVWYMRKMHRERISTKVTLRNTIYRSIFDGKTFLNDPDVFLLRDDNIKMGIEQRKALTTINALFGSLLMTSDNPKTYGEKQESLLKNALKLFREAEPLGFETRKDRIDVKYILDGKEHTFTYNIDKGIIEE